MNPDAPEKRRGVLYCDHGEYRVWCHAPPRSEQVDKAINVPCVIHIRHDVRVKVANALRDLVSERGVDLPPTPVAAR